TIRAAYPASSAHSVPPITPASSRAPKVSGYQDDRAVIRFSSANPHSTVTSTGRRGRPRRVTTTGIAVSTPVTAYPETRKPTWACDTPRPRVMAGSSPAGSISVVTAVKAAADRVISAGHGMVRGVAPTMEVDMPPMVKPSHQCEGKPAAELAAESAVEGRQHRAQQPGEPALLVGVE